MYKWRCVSRLSADAKGKLPSLSIASVELGPCYITSTLERSCVRIFGSDAVRLVWNEGALTLLQAVVPFFLTYVILKSVLKCTARAVEAVKTFMVSIYQLKNLICDA
jgi:hypothetical protein